MVSRTRLLLASAMTTGFVFLFEVRACTSARAHARSRARAQHMSVVPARVCDPTIYAHATPQIPPSYLGARAAQAPAHGAHKHERVRCTELGQIRRAEGPPLMPESTIMRLCARARARAHACVYAVCVGVRAHCTSLHVHTHVAESRLVKCPGSMAHVAMWLPSPWPVA